tara:strand:+ start:105 stop:968 length:864 start_codon:yes stop_codon:yes gene_type:complete
MATLNLGRIKPVFRGAYAGGTAYVVDDIVTHGDETFICILASTGNATSNATYWTKLAAKGTDGTNGTDVGTVITTQGDILYRDGSGLQRLPKGTANQLLQINSGATAPEWTTFSASDYVKVAEGSVTNDATWDFASTIFDNSIYMNYDVFLEAEHHDGTQSGNAEFRLIDSSGNNIGSSTTSGNVIEMNSSSTSVNGYQRDGADSAIFYQDGFRNTKGLYMLTIQGMGRAEEKTGNGFSTRANHDGTTRTRTSWWSFFCTQNAATGWGFRFQFTAGATGTYKIFGRK